MASKASKDVRWWVKDHKEDSNTVIFDNVRRIRDRTSLRRRQDLYHACLYGDMELAGVLGANLQADVDFDPSRLAFNVIRRNVDTLTAKIAKNKPLPTPLTSGGTRVQQTRAKNLGKFIEGWFDRCRVWRTSPVVARDAGLFGTGITHNYRVGKQIISERVFPWEIHVDPREAMYGAPRNMYMRRWVDRLVLVERFPKFEAEIDQAQNSSDPEDAVDLGYDESSDMVLVEEAWHLRSSPDADDGWHAIAISTKTLLKEPYNRDYFPLCFLRMTEPVAGVFGTGLAELLTGIQYTINEMAAMVQERMLMSGGFVFVENSSDVQTDHIDNSGISILRYTRTEPKWVTPQPVHPDLYNFLEKLIPQSFQQTGVSELSANSQLPKGMKDASGVAINTYNDIETERFSLFAKAYETYHIDLAWQLFDLFDEIGDSLEVNVPNRKAKSMQKLSFKDVKLDREEFNLFVYPTSGFSKEPSAKIQEIQALAQTGSLTADEVKMLLDFPDFERIRDLSSASYELVQLILERMLDAEDPDSPEAYIAPEEFMDLNLCAAMGLQEYLKGKFDGVDQRNLALVADFIKDSKDMLTQQEAPPPQDATSPDVMPENLKETMKGPPPMGAPPAMGPPGPPPGPMPPMPPQ